MGDVACKSIRHHLILISNLINSTVHEFLSKTFRNPFDLQRRLLLLLLFIVMSKSFQNVSTSSRPSVTLISYVLIGKMCDITGLFKMFFSPSSLFLYDVSHVITRSKIHETK